MADSNTLIGFLSGTIFTGAISAIAKVAYDIFTKNQDLKREMLKLTYSKKLDAAEKAVAFYYTAKAYVVQIGQLYNILVSGLKDIEGKHRNLEIVEKLLTKNGELLTELSTIKFQDINAIHLYYELDDERLWSDKDVENLIKTISDVSTLQDEMLYWVKCSNDQNSQAENNDSSKKIVELLPNYIERLEALIAIYEKNKTATAYMIKTIKGEIRK